MLFVLPTTTAWWDVGTIHYNVCLERHIRVQWCGCLSINLVGLALQLDMHVKTKKQ